MTMQKLEELVKIQKEKSKKSREEMKDKIEELRQEELRKGK